MAQVTERSGDVRGAGHGAVRRRSWRRSLSGLAAFVAQVTERSGDVSGAHVEYSIPVGERGSMKPTITSMGGVWKHVRTTGQIEQLTFTGSRCIRHCIGMLNVCPAKYYIIPITRRIQMAFAVVIMTIILNAFQRQIIGFML